MNLFSKRIRNKAKKLNLKNLEYLCLLESSFKSKQIEKDDLQSYSFKRESGMLVLSDVSYKIFLRFLKQKICIVLYLSALREI